MGGAMLIRKLTWIIPYYCNAPMLRLHMENLASYPAEFLANLRVIYVDDGSPEPERPDRILRGAPSNVKPSLVLYRIKVDIPWNWHGARNLGVKVADSFWLLLTDMDRIFMARDAQRLMTRKLDRAKYYKPTGVDVVGQGQFKLGKLPINQLVCSREQYWHVGGYDEDYAGAYSGDKQFLDALGKFYPREVMEDVRLFRYTNAILPGSETVGLSRQEGLVEFRKRHARKVQEGRTTPINPIRFPWMRVEL
jgi:hypothetical protein